MYSANTGTEHISSNTSAKKLTDKTQDDSLRKQEIYQTCISTSSYYTRRLEIDTRKGLLRKLAGIPLAFFYGFFLVIIISNTLLGSLNQSTPHTSVQDDRSPKRICDYVLSQLKNHSMHAYNITGQFDLSAPHLHHDEKYPNKTINDKDTQTDQNSTKNHQRLCGNDLKFIFENDCIELYYSVGGVMTFVGLSSIFSRNIRTCMLLLLPGLITRHSRHLIFTITLGILANGPMKNLQDNFNRILENAICVQKSGVNLACIKQLEVKEVVDYAENVYNELHIIKDSFNRMLCPRGKVDIYGNVCHGLPDYIFPFRNISFDVLSTISHPSSFIIRQHAALMMNKVIGLKYYGDIGRRCLTVISIILLVADAVRYLRYYHTDSSFDNWCVSRAAYRLVEIVFKKSIILPILGLK